MITYILIVLWLLLVAIPSVSALRRHEIKRGLKIMKFINRFLLDVFTKVNDKVYGFTLFCGCQGGGKTYNAVRYVKELTLQKKCKVITNTPLGIESVFISDISEIKYHIDEKINTVIFLDEIQTLFDSRNMDKEFYSLFCQLRKRGIKIVGTSQVFERCALPLREQVNDLYYCTTFFGCLSLVTKVYPMINNSGKLEARRVVLGRRLYVQTDDVRQIYNTMYRI